MGYILESSKRPSHRTHRLESLKTLTLLILQEIESLAEVASDPKEEITAAQHETPVYDHQTGSIDLNDEVLRYELTLISEALRECQGNQTLAAKKLRMKYTTLNSKIQRYKIRF